MRVLLITIVTLALSYGATAIGSEVHHIWEVDPGIGSYFCVFGILLAGVVGGISWGGTVLSLLQGERSDSDHPILSTPPFPVACFSFIFGIIAGPFYAYGPAPWNWTGGWSAFLVVAFIPLLLYASPRPFWVRWTRA
jgi:hypothetical protein